MERTLIFRTPLAFWHFFAYFLEQEGCFDKFKRNLDGFYLFGNYCNHVYCLDPYSIDPFAKAIIAAFDFHLTPEGSAYWLSVNSKWSEFLSSK